MVSPSDAASMPAVATTKAGSWNSSWVVNKTNRITPHPDDGVPEKKTLISKSDVRLGGGVATTQKGAMDSSSDGDVVHSWAVSAGREMVCRVVYNKTCK